LARRESVAACSVCGEIVEIWGVIKCVILIWDRAEAALCIVVVAFPVIFAF
jgi:hypothetical protein